jgi:hypothetical protein
MRLATIRSIMLNYSRPCTNICLFLSSIVIFSFMRHAGNLKLGRQEAVNSREKYYGYR